MVVLTGISFATRCSIRTHSLRHISQAQPPAAPVLAPLTDGDDYERAHAFSRFANWVIPGQLMVGRYPYIEPGLNQRCDTHEKGMKQIQQILDEEIRTFVCLQEELPPQKQMTKNGVFGFLPHYAWCEQLANSVEFLHFPIEDLSIPKKEKLNTLLHDLERRLCDGEKMYLHCWGGRGRAGLVACCLLAKAYKISGDEALERIGRAFSTRRDSSMVFSPWILSKLPFVGYRSPQTSGQIQFVRDFAQSYAR